MRKLLATLAAILMLSALDSPAALAQADATELSFWESVRDSDQPRELEAYLKAYPDGTFASLARLRIEKLRGSDAQPEPARSLPSVKEAGATEEASELEPAASSPPVHDCDRLAAHPNYAFEGVAGVSGETIPTDKAIKACREALAAHPDTERFQFQLARALHYGNFYEESRQRFQVLAEKGHAGAALNLGLIYGHGRGVTRDHKEAARWFRQAAEAGDAFAMATLGYLYKQGLGVRQSNTEAIAWYRKAIDKNESEGFYRLAAMYAEGRGMPKNMFEAARLYRRAADMGNIEAMLSLSRMYSAGEGVFTDKVEAVRWLQNAAEKGSPDAMTSLGFACQVGEGVDKDFSQAAEWYRKAADNGNATAKNNLGILYNDGTGVSRDGKEAARLLLEAYRGGDTYAKRNLEEQSTVLTLATRRELQRLLKQEGVYDGAIDGRFGSGTKRALKALAPAQDAVGQVQTSSSGAGTGAQSQISPGSAIIPREGSSAPDPEDLGNLSDLDKLD